MESYWQMMAISAQVPTGRSQAAKPTVPRERQSDVTGGVVGETMGPGNDLSAAAAVADDFSREVYCVLGIPIDAIGMGETVRLIEAAAAGGRRFLLSTPNLNFLVTSYRDPEFRESLRISDLCPADGMAIVWIAKLLGVPIKSRIAGSDIFEALKMRRDDGERLKVFFFGGNDGVARAAGAALNARDCGLCCVGAISPGFGSIEAMSQSETLEHINSSRADVLVAALGAQKGQAWLRRNHESLRVPIRAHLGATINFEAGTVRRAPTWVRRSGCEWLWRIKEEPRLWRRYFNDAMVLYHLFLTRAAPLALETLWTRIRRRPRPKELLVSQEQIDNHLILRIVGDAVAKYVPEATPCIRAAAATCMDVIVELSGARRIDARFLGLLLMLTKQLLLTGKSVTLVGASVSLTRSLRRHGADLLLVLRP